MNGARGIRGAAGLVGAAVVLSVSACGGDDDQSSFGGEGPTDAIELTRYLPPNAPAFSTVDLAALEDDLDLQPEDNLFAVPVLADLVGSSVSGIYASNPSKEVLAALDMSEATALASANGETNQFVTAIATDADTADIQASLEDLGFVETDGVFEGPDGEEAVGEPVQSIKSNVGSPANLKFEHRPIAIRFFDGGFLASNDGDLLRSLSSEADELPLEVLGSLTGDMTVTVAINQGCLIDQATQTNADGSGGIIFVIKGTPDPSHFSPEGNDTFGEPTVSGDRLLVPIEGDSPEQPRAILSDTFATYEC